jgi:hypothetical protein
MCLFQLGRHCRGRGTMTISVGSVIQLLLCTDCQNFRENSAIPARIVTIQKKMVQ